MALTRLLPKSGPCRDVRLEKSVVLQPHLPRRPLASYISHTQSLADMTKARLRRQSEHLTPWPSKALFPT